ncbi:hypothetical protein SLEP1_g21906 [Rubroshorea leprosula]|uniref:Uncharacterized protein n=1 Tax=Rubroshorea leprosula TaxID=152421 RepID=A0AAV5JGC1_9ROSI|nr:hypothetical protein SLEP1_g21906 [Rubroshorea leprosula]
MNRGAKSAKSVGEECGSHVEIPTENQEFVVTVVVAENWEVLRISSLHFGYPARPRGTSREGFACVQNYCGARAEGTSLNPTELVVLPLNRGSWMSRATPDVRDCASRAAMECTTSDWQHASSHDLCQPTYLSDTS